MTSQELRAIVLSKYEFDFLEDFDDWLKGYDNGCLWMLEEVCQILDEHNKENSKK